ncbi:MAG TPA: universal stress protein [Actinoplanes sp.]|nr:universal stress protein [Actinoplanes sp.]
MTTTALYVGIAVLWIGAGVGAAVFLGRRGHRSWAWYVIGAILGLMFVPIAAERARRGTHHLTTVRAAGEPEAGDGRMTVLVGVDASAEARRALADVVHVFGTVRPRLVLVSVMDHDTVESGDRDQIAGTRRMLEAHADRLSAHLPRPAVEMASGPPAAALIEVAERCDADVIVVGRRGAGLSKRVLGSVADHLVHRSSRPVMLGGSGRA